MPTDLRLQPLDELLFRHPGWRGVLEEFGISGREGTSITLAAAAARVNADVEAVLAAMSAPRRERWRCDTIASAPLRAVLDHVEDVHHALMRQQFDEVTEAIAGQLRLHPDEAGLMAADDAFAEFRSDMEAHLEMEEHVLFPLCRDLIDAFSWPSFHSGPIADPIRSLVHDHDHVAGLLDEVAACCEQGSEIERLVQEVAADLHRHLAEENRLLFPEILCLAEEYASS